MSDMHRTDDAGHDSNPKLSSHEEVACEPTKDFGTAIKAKMLGFVREKSKD